MIENYNEVMEQWGCGCGGTMTISPSEDLKRWAVQQTITVLANADYYYTKTEVDKLLESITHGDVAREEVEAMIQSAIASKAEQADLDALSAQVAQNIRDILERPTNAQVNSLLERYLTKIEANSMFANYSKIEGTTLELNAENITN